MITLLLLLCFWIASALIVLLAAWLESRVLSSKEPAIGDEQWSQFWAPHGAKGDTVTDTEKPPSESGLVNE